LMDSTELILIREVQSLTLCLLLLRSNINGPNGGASIESREWLSQ
jgi:hypothetical protein